jgi:hypothetical protein
MSYTPPPKFYPLIVETPGGEFELSEPWHVWFMNLARANTGFTGTVPLAKITGGGADGSLTITNGIITAATAPT